jgi:hypothetical protein
VRHCVERGLAESTFGTFECLGSVELHARTVPMRVGGWRVYATDVAWLDQVVGSIEEQSSSSSSSSSSIAGRWLRVGCLDGGALAAGLERWADARRSHGGCVKSLEVLAAVVRNAGPVTWRMAEPEPGRLEAEMVLRPVDASALDGAAMAGVRP